MQRPEDYLKDSDVLMSQAVMPLDPEGKSVAYRVEAQIRAVQAMAAALDRLAVAVENLPR
ncbi:MAG TPA: hypothetical protein VGL33_05330 [Streptosporangiaceae bacterium]